MAGKGRDGRKQTLSLTAYDHVWSLQYVTIRIRRSTGRPNGRPVGTTSTQMDARRHRVMVREQSRLLRKEQIAIAQHVEEQRAANPAWMMPKEMMERSEMISQFLVRVPHAVARNQAILDEAEQSVPTAQLEAQLRHELVRSASSWSDEEWALVDAQRAKKRPGRWVLDAERSAA